MKALVNGVDWELADGATVADVLARLHAPDTGIAVARSGELVPRAAWASTPLVDGDTVEVLTAVQGG
jgi:sulfur carrier protein